MPPSVASPARTAVEPWYRRAGVVTLVAVASGLGVLLAVWVSGGGNEAEILDNAGPVTRVLMPVARLGGELAALALVAGLAACLLAGSRSGRRELPGSVPAWALAWSGVSAASALLSASEVSNLPVVDVLRTGLVLDYLTIIPQARTHALTALIALGVAVASTLVVRWPRPDPRVVALLLAPTAVALALPLTTGHSASAANHDLAIASLVVHVLAAVAWVGGLAGLVVHLRRDHDPLALAVGRFDGVALSAFVVVGASGVANVLIRLESPGELLATTYGWLLLAKVAALVVLGCFGARHRRRTIGELRAGSPSAFRRLAAVEVAVMTATVGLAVALSRTPTP